MHNDILLPRLAFHAFYFGSTVDGTMISAEIAVGTLFYRCIELQQA